jgi:DHA1 family tetracycline resistance protein-like MFS transporter
MQFLATPILGQLSDKFGRKPLLAFSLLGTCLSYILFAIGIITKNIPLLFFARAFDGITGGNIAVAQAVIADITKPENRAKNFGLIGAAFGLGFIIGPFIGGKLSDPHVVSWFNAATPFWFAAILSFGNVLSVWFRLDETHPAQRHDMVIAWNKSVHNVIRAFSLPALRPLYITSFLFQGGFTFFTTFFSVFLIKRFGFSQGNIGDFFAYVGIWIVFTQAVVTRLVRNRFDENQALKVTLFGCGLAIFAYFLPTVWWGLLIVVPFFAIFNGVSQANLTSLVSRSVDHTMQGEILGINSSVQAFAQTIPPIISGLVAAELSPVAPVFISAVIILLAGVVFVIFFKPVVVPITEEV